MKFCFSRNDGEKENHERERKFALRKSIRRTRDEGMVFVFSVIWNKPEKK